MNFWEFIVMSQGEWKYMPKAAWMPKFVFPALIFHASAIWVFATAKKTFTVEVYVQKMAMAVQMH